MTINKTLAVSAKDVRYSYPDRDILTGASFQVMRGHITLLVGDNGAGKSTLIKLVLGELVADSGEILLFGESPDKFSQWEKVGYVPQFEAAGAIGFPATVEEIVASGFMHKSHFSLSTLEKRQRKQAIDEALESCGVLNLKKKLIGSLSGGQRQRVMLARALVAKPELLVLDEPTAALDLKASNSFFNLLEALCHKSHMAALVVTHDLARMECEHAKTIALIDGKCVYDIEARG